MNGVDILAMEEVCVELAFNWTLFWTAVSIFGVIGFLISMTIQLDWQGAFLITAIGLALGALVGMLLGYANQTPEKFETQYKVTISDEVKMTDFLERYEIIDTEGKIYTVREKGADEN